MWWVVVGALALLAVVLARVGGEALAVMGMLLLVVGIVAAVKARPSWGPLSSRRAGIGVAVAGLILGMLGVGPSAASDPASARQAVGALATSTPATATRTVNVTITAVATTTEVSTAPAPPPVPVTQTETVTIPAPVAAAVEEPAVEEPAVEVPAVVAPAPEPEVVAPQTQAAPAPQALVPQTPQQTSRPQAAAASYANCTEAWDAGAAPIRRGEPGYAAKLDRNDDGVACEERP